MVVHHDGKASAMRRRDLVLALIAPVLLVALATTQVFHASTRDLTPWKGGGFGMFASTDGLNYRAVHARFLTDGEPMPIAVHDFGGEDRATWRFIHARALPDERRLGRLVERIEGARWRIEGSVARFDAWLPDGVRGPVVTTRAGGEGQAVAVTGVQVDVWGVFYTRGDGHIEPRMVGRHTVEYEVGRE